MLNVSLLAGIASCFAIVWAWYAWLPFDDEMPRRWDLKRPGDLKLIRFVIRSFPTFAGVTLCVQVLCGYGFMTYLPVDGEWFRPERRWLWLFTSCVSLLPPMMAFLARVSLTAIRAEIDSRPPPIE